MTLRVFKPLFLSLLILSTHSWAEFTPPESELETWDWVQLISGEWLKGEIIVMYDENLEFDSDILDDLSLDWDDVKQVIAARPMKVRLDGRVDKKGKLTIQDDTLYIGGEPFPRSSLITVTTGEELERNLWAIKYNLGANFRSGNTDSIDMTSTLKLQRRTVANRFVLDHVANYSETEQQETAKNQRGSAAWDYFLSDRFFLRPIFGEYTSDDFQNIDHKYTIGTGAGYQIFDASWIEWRLTGGPAYQETSFITVLPEEEETERTPALVGVSNFGLDITSDIEFYHDYTFYFVNKESGRYVHYMIAGFSIDITSLLDLDISLAWDRTEKPKADENGEFPEKNDYRLVVGFGIDY